MNKAELKPCPFCGGKAIAQQEFAGGLIMCTKCGVFMRNITGFNVDDIIPKWNKRYIKRESTALLPCRFCGSKRHSYWALSNGYTCIGCSKCGTQAEGAKTEIQARRNWNALMKEGVENNDRKVSNAATQEV